MEYDANMKIIFYNLCICCTKRHVNKPLCIADYLISRGEVFCSEVVAVYIYSIAIAVSYISMTRLLQLPHSFPTFIYSFLTFTQSFFLSVTVVLPFFWYRFPTFSRHIFSIWFTFFLPSSYRFLIVLLQYSYSFFMILYSFFTISLQYFCVLLGSFILFYVSSQFSYNSQFPPPPPYTHGISTNRPLPNSTLVHIPTSKTMCGIVVILLTLALLTPYCYNMAAIIKYGNNDNVSISYRIIVSSANF